jgi:hypothetical protein
MWNFDAAGTKVWNKNWLLTSVILWHGNIHAGAFFDTPDWVHFYSDPGGADVKERRDRAKQLSDYFTECIK